MDFRLGPHEWFGVFIVVFDEGIDVRLDLLDRGKRHAIQRLALQDREPALDLIEPRGARRRKVECHERVTPFPSSYSPSFVAGSWRSTTRAPALERTVTYRRKVRLEVEETDERLRDERRYPKVFKYETEGAAADSGFHETGNNQRIPAQTKHFFQPEGSHQVRAVPISLRAPPWTRSSRNRDSLRLPGAQPGRNPAGTCSQSGSQCDIAIKLRCNKKLTRYGCLLVSPRDKGISVNLGSVIQFDVIGLRCRRRSQRDHIVSPVARMHVMTSSIGNIL
jgi:hypothetical protein